jgi:hypothetical protein
MHACSSKAANNNAWIVMHHCPLPLYSICRSLSGMRVLALCGCGCWCWSAGAILTFDCTCFASGLQHIVYIYTNHALLYSTTVRDFCPTNGQYIKLIILKWHLYDLDTNPPNITRNRVKTHTDTGCSTHVLRGIQGMSLFSIVALPSLSVWAVRLKE